FNETISLFEHALALDPRSSEAQSYLAIELTGRVLDDMTDTAAADFARAEGLAGKALAASPQRPRAFRKRSSTTHAASIRRGNSRIRNGAGAQSLLDGRIRPARVVQAPYRVD